VAVSLSLATERGSVPVGYQLYLPKEWAEDDHRRSKYGVPDRVAFATKPEIGARSRGSLILKPGEVRRLRLKSGRHRIDQHREALPSLAQ